MKIVDIRLMLLRAYIKFLLSEVVVIPKKDYEISLPYGKIMLHVGEEKKLPRFIARVLRKNNIVEVRDDLDSRSIMGQLISYISMQVSKPKIIELPEGFFYMVAEAVGNLSAEKREKLKTELTRLIKARLSRIIHRVYTEKYEGLDYGEVDLLKIMVDLKKTFEQNFVDEILHIIKMFDRKKESE
ncbi:MAG: hypothetical protein Q6363_008370 [Candidatus Njordarchaeota archaeon]